MYLLRLSVNSLPKSTVTIITLLLLPKMALPNVITWKGCCICDSNPWNITQSALENVLNNEIAMMFVRGMISNNEHLRTSSLIATANLIVRVEEDTIMNVFKPLLNVIIRNMMQAFQFGDIYTLRYACHVLSAVTYIAPKFNNNIITNESNYNYYDVLDLFTSVGHDFVALEFCAIALGNIIYDGTKNDNKWEFQFDSVEKINQIKNDVLQSVAATKMVVWTLRMFLEKNKSRDTYGEYITTQTIKLITSFNRIRSVDVYKEIASGLCKHSVVKLLSPADAKSMIGRITIPLRSGWPVLYYAPIMEILAYTVWCFRNRSDVVEKIIKKSLLNAICQLDPHGINNELQDLDKAAPIITWIMLFYLKYFRATGIIVKHATKFNCSAIEIDDDDMKKIGIYTLGTMIENGTQKQINKISNVNDIFVAFSQEQGKHTKDHDRTIEKVTNILIFGNE